jgi:Putative transposase/Transposase zinc-binding domain
MPRAALEVADIFRSYGAAWREAHAGHLSLGQLKAMAAIEACRTAALGGHVAACEDCGHTVIAYNSCGNRHCPKCQGSAARAWLAEQEAGLLPLPYYHVVFTLPSAIGAIAWQNKAEVYGLLFKAASETMLTIAADPKHLGARIGMTAVLHSWGSALTHHPHVHMIVPGGGLSLHGERFIPCRRRFFLPVRVLSRLFRRLMLERLAAAYGQGRLMLQGGLAKLATPAAFAAALKPLRRMNWFVYAKRPFAGPKAVLAYLSRYTHRVAISNTRLIAHDGRGVTFHYKDYRADGLARRKTMTLETDEFIRRFLLHILPRGFHRIRHYGLFANTGRAANIARLRELLGATPAPSEQAANPRQESPAHRDFRARNAAPIPGAIPGRYPDRYVMSWNSPLKRTMPHCFTAGSQTARPSLCLRRLPVQEITAKTLPVAASSPQNWAPISRIGLVAIQQTRVPLTNAAGVPPKSP